MNEAISILRRISLGQIVPQIAIRGGFSLLGGKFSGFDSGNAVFIVPLAGIVYIPLSAIVGIVL